VWVAALLAASLATGYVFACYWLAPSTVASAMAHPLTDWPAALTAYGMTVVLAADMLWVRRKFCAGACPYGPLMSLLADRNTLAVRYLDERTDDCIRCGRCETVCPMGIDIKQGVGQVDCIGCGECVDACSDVLGKRGKAGLIEFRYGVAPERQSHSLTLRQRLGLWDRKRGAVVFVVLACLSVVLWNLYGRLPLGASVIANGAITRDAQEVRNTFLLTLANGTPDTHRYRISVEGLAGGRIVPTEFVTVAARDRRSVPLTVAAPAASMTAESRTPIRLRVQDGREVTTIQTIFFTPAP
jgi:polyferredoxin